VNEVRVSGGRSPTPETRIFSYQNERVKMGNGIITKIFGWITHPTIDTETEPIDWLAGLVVVLILSFLWSRVVKQIVEA
jgi:hypothetical protein